MTSRGESPGIPAYSSHDTAWNSRIPPEATYASICDDCAATVV
jgi:hypothetical protein